MNRTQRLLHLLQIFRNRRYAVSGEYLAGQLGISIRTLYRDIASLQAMGAEINGEAGVGYILKPTFFLPPLMFSQNEIQSLLLGIQWVSQFGDSPLSKAATEALNKIMQVLPSNMKNTISQFSLRVGPPASESLMKEDLSPLRDAINNQKKISIIYTSENTRQSQQTVWPFAIGYFTDSRILVSWCENQKKYLHFKTDKIVSIKILDDRYPGSQTKLFREWRTLQLKNINKK